MSRALDHASRHVALGAALALAWLGACGNSSSPARPATAPAGSAGSAAATAPAPTPRHGRIETQRFASAALGVTKSVVVYLPAGYDDDARRWPVFYYLHGLGGNETNWVEGGKLDEIADRVGLGAIVVMPDGDDSFYADSLVTPSYDACMRDGTGLLMPGASKTATCVRTPAYETYLTKDLIGWVDQTYRTIAAREGRAIAGLSMGGFGALQVSLRNRELFAAAASHSGVDALLYAGPIPYAAGKVQLEDDVTRWGAAVGPLGAWVRAIFGTDIARWRAHDPAVLIADPANQPALYLDCGTEDEFLLHNGAQYVHDLLRERGIEHAWYLGPGRHNFGFWSARLPHSLAFLTAHVTAAR